MTIREQWAIAQEHERKHHSGSLEQGVEAYRDTYRQYFECLQMTPNLMNHEVESKSIVEIGCADVPALNFCKNYGPSYIIEPLPSPILKELTVNFPITIIDKPAEDIDFPQVDEVWLFNVLQHVIDPDVIINKCKEAAKVIRFFEPINDSTDLCHLHTFTLEYFQKHFGGCVKEYEDHKGRVVNFHEHQCAYGVWIK